MTPRDTTIKRCITEYGPLTVNLLALLKAKEPTLGAADTLWRRLQGDKPLVADKHIFVRRSFPGQHYVYASWDISKRKDVNHDLITSAVHIALDSFFNLLQWRQPREKFKGKLNEDAYFILGVQLPDRLAECHYYLESDTGSEGYAQIENKLERYLKYHRETGELFKVLFVCADAARANDLARRAAKVVPKEKRKAYLFTSVAELVATPNAAICRVPHQLDEPCRILPAVK